MGECMSKVQVPKSTPKIGTFWPQVDGSIYPPIHNSRIPMLIDCTYWPSMQHPEHRRPNHCGGLIGGIEFDHGVADMEVDRTL